MIATSDGIPIFPCLMIGLLPLLCFILFMLLSRDAIHAITKRWESRPTWTAKDDAELSKLMRE